MRSRDDYFAAGMRLLGEGGVAAVTIANLCAALGVTKGSFYHHFTNVDDYRAQLLTHWAGERQRQVAAEVAREPDALSRLDALRRHGVHVDHAAEAAIRIWSRTDPRTSKVRQKVDRVRQQGVADSYRAIGVPDDEADLLGELLVLVLIGAQLRGGRVDRHRLDEVYGWVHEQAVARANALHP